MNDNRLYKGKKILLVDGSTRQVLPLMKSFHDLGCFVATYNSSRFDMGYASRYPDKKVLSYCSNYDEKKTYHSILNELKTEKYDLVIPTNDFIATILSVNKSELSTYAYICVNNWDIFQIAIDKLKTMNVCMANNIPSPITACEENDLSVIDKYDLKFPIVVKPRISYAAIGFSVVNNMNELKSIFAAVSKKFGGALFQEFIPQTKKQYNAQLYIDRNGEMKSAIVYTKIRWYPVTGGSSTLNVTIDRPDILENCRKLLKAIDYKGYAEIEAIDDPRDNVAKLMEINPRVTGSLKICFLAGVNFSEQFLQDALDLPVTNYLEYKKDVYLRFRHTDILWFIKSKDRFKTNPSWFRHMFVKDQIFSFNDIIPFFAYTFTGLKKFCGESKRRSL